MADEVTEEQLEQIDQSHRVMHAYLAGLITGEGRDQLKALYEQEHKTHTRRYSNCALCETQSIMAALEYESPFLRSIKRES
jgi:hypothetical protein